MERPKISGQPSLLTDIPEHEFEGAEPQGDGAPESSQNQVQASHRLQYTQSPRRPPPTAFNNPSSRSYLHVQQLLSFYRKSAMDNPSTSAPASLRAERSDIQTPSPTLDRSRDAALTRSSSASDIRLLVPSIVPRSLSSSPLDPSSLSSSPADDCDREPHRTDARPSVHTGTMNLKLLTCYWWLQTGNCRFSAKDCLYAHHDTGKHAEAPRQVIPGQPAVAGRNADRKLRQAESHLTSLHLNDARGTNPNPNMRIHASSSSVADKTNIFHPSIPSTPGLLLRSPHAPNTPGIGQPILPSVIIPNSPLHFATTNTARLEHEVRFFHTLVEQGGKEKEFMANTIESLQAENQALRTTNTTINADNARLTEERDVLRAALTLLQQQQQKATGSPLSRSSTPISSLRRATPGSASWADFGAIGGKRNAT